MRATLLFLLTLVLHIQVHAQGAASMFPYGEKEALMFNSGLTLRGSGASIAYNPAGLTSSPSTKISASGSLFYQNEFGFARNKGFRIQDTSTLSPFLGTVWKREKFSYGVGIFTPYNTRFEADTEDPTNGMYGNSKPHTNYSSSEVRLVLAAAKNFGDHDFGVSLGLYQVTRDSTVTYFSSTPSQSRARSYHTRTNSRLYGALLSVGSLHKITDNYDVSAKITLPNLHVDGTADRQEEMHTYDNNAFSATVSEKDGQPIYFTPIEFTFGQAYRSTSQATVYLDASYRAPMKYTSEGSVYKEIGTFRGNIGTEYKLSGYTTLLAGAQVVPHIIVESDIKSKAVMWGLSAGAIFTEKRYQTGLGLFYAKNQPQAGSVDKSDFQIYGLIATSSFDFQ